MIIQSISLHKYRGVSKRIKFDPVVIRLESESAGVILEAIGILTKNETLSGPLDELELAPEVKLTGYVRLIDGTYVIRFSRETESGKFVWAVRRRSGEDVDPVTFFKRIHVPPEEESVGYYLTSVSYADILNYYRDPEEQTPPGEFRRRTEGLGETGTFRKALHETVRERKWVEPDNAEELRENYMLFLQINKLWQKVENIRNLYYEPLPLVITADEETPDNDTAADLIVKAGSLGRQIVLIENKKTDDPGIVPKTVHQDRYYKSRKQQGENLP